MDVFDLRSHLIATYREYTTSFVKPRERRVRRFVDDELEMLWPHARVGLNPSFEPGRSVDGLVADGVLHPAAGDIFRRDKSESDVRGRELRLYRHQEEAVRVAAGGRSYVLTTGTGSGKSLAYIVPIVDHVLRSGSGGGVKAIVVYPMNALANSQMEELGKFLDYGPWEKDRPPVTFARYTGQDDVASRERLKANPPDILLTNYVMLELILTRYTDQDLVRALRSLRFLVLDELHTYRGRQGADVALLARRLREASRSPDLMCVGTSATLSTEGSVGERQSRLAEVGSRLFGVDVDPADVIGETLKRATQPFDDTDRRSVAELARRVEDGSPPGIYDEFVADPVSSWVESTLGVDYEEGMLVRAQPLPVKGGNGAASRLADLTGLEEAVCAETIERYLLDGSRIPDKESDGPVFAFRLHQFISRGDTVYASPEAPSERYLTMSGQRFVPGSDRARVLLPLAFCRVCGHDYYVASNQPTDGGGRLVPRGLSDHKPGGGLVAGFLFVSDTDPWPDDAAEQLERLPRDWFDHNGKLLKSRQKALPLRFSVRPDGSIGGTDGVVGWWTPVRFRFCLACGTSYASPNLGNDFARLADLGSGGRASATTIMSLAAVHQLRSSDNIGLERKAQKLLSFTDNRQDASLQAGHFNDFVEVTMLRSALWRAVSASPGGVKHDVLPQRVFDALALPRTSYALNPDLRGQARRNTDRTMREVLAYRLYRDLRRGWRVTQPNLEQVGLLSIEYESVSELAADHEIWERCHPALAGCAPQRRESVLVALLDWIRRELAVRVDVLNDRHQEALRLRAGQWLAGSWSLGQEELERARAVLTRPKRGGDRYWWRHVTGRGTFGRFLAQRAALGSATGAKLTVPERNRIIREIFAGLNAYGLLIQVGGREPHERWQISSGAMIWKPGDGAPVPDPLRMSIAGRGFEPRANSFFRERYRNPGTDLAAMEGREHTAQVSGEQRQERERRFRAGDLPVIFCSPTMELGVDISELNVVNMRNVPPTPANYAQRSGRAGRGGQPALVFTYCSSGNRHDQYFFRRQEKMISGQVEAPRIDLANEGLLRAHVQAMWLAESGLDLGRSMRDIVDIPDDGGQPSLKVRVVDHLGDSRTRVRTRARALGVLEGISEDLSAQPWWTDKWLDETLDKIPGRFRRALQRWTTLYTAALSQVHEQTRVAASAHRSSRDRKAAKRLRAEAERQLEVLWAEADQRYQSDFYTYRYFASEGFLPGYSFPRLPLSAFISGRRFQRGGGQRGDYVQRPRFLAISEFGPQASIYHEGARYQINKVILSRDADALEGAEPGGLTVGAKRCDACGYMHEMAADHGRDVCESCGEELGRGGGLDNLLQMRNVTTRHQSRITSDEERRRRAGYELISGLRWADRHNRPATATTVTSPDGEAVLDLTYGDTATIWRINLGWRRRGMEESGSGFVLNVETGEWASRRSTGGDSSGDPDPDAVTTKRVIPFVKDSRNALLITPVDQLSIKEMASVGAVLKAAIQVVFHLEASELEVEPLPNREDRRLLLAYESAEGGAGVLRRLVSEPHIWQRVAQAALAICHDNPHTGGLIDDEDSGCGAACYDCLLTYQNQFDHQLLDRAHAVPFLQRLVTAQVDIPIHKRGLAATTSLERKFLEHLEAGGWRLPDRSQVYFSKAGTRPDYVYDDAQVAIYVDGPHHDDPDRAARDRQIDTAMRNLGRPTIRFGHRDDWDRIIAQHPAVFGPGHREPLL